MQSTTILNDKKLLRTDYVIGGASTLKPPGDAKALPEATASELPKDAREQLYNGGEVGPIAHVQVSIERVATLNAILFDLDPQNLRVGTLLPALCQDPEEFFERCVKRWLGNHPLLQHMEVRASGTGLHAILWLGPPVEFATDAERTRWSAIAKIVQAVLPTDPLAPGITATTRGIGSINTKNGREVRRLKEGTPVSPADVISLSEEMCAAPFRTLFTVLTGTDRMSPCPFCGKETLVALNHIGKCYVCDKVTFERLCSELFQPSKGTEG